MIDPLIAAGDLPNLARLLERGARGRLRSTTHPLTPLAWTTMVTGVNAGRHGIWDFSERDESGYRLRLVNGSDNRAPALWTRLSAAGRRVGVVNVPFTWPAPEVDGFVIAGMDACGARGRDDDAARADLGAAGTGSGSSSSTTPSRSTTAGGSTSPRSAPSASSASRSSTGSSPATSPSCSSSSSWRPTTSTISAGPSGRSGAATAPSPRCTGSSTDSLGELLERVGDGNVLVVSDHGGGALRGVVNLNAWLAQEGFLAYAARGEPGRQRPPPAVRAAAEAAAGASRRGEAAAYPACASALTVRGRPRSSTGPRTRAFSYGVFGNIVVNLRGRERDGIVEPGAEYEQVRDEIAARLLELRAPDGEPIVAAVHRREDLYAGPELAKIPDLIVEFRDYAWLGKGNLTGRTPTIWDTIAPRAHPGATYVGSHRPDGIFVLAGPSARAGVELSAGIADVAPTALYLLGEPIPGRARGAAARRGDRPRAARRAPAGVRGAGRGRGRRAPRRTTPRERPRSRSGCGASATSSRRAARASRGRRARAGWRRPRAAAPRQVRRPRPQAARVLDERHEPGLGEPAAERELVVVDRLAVASQARHHDRTLAVRERRQDRADPRVADDDARTADLGHELLVREILDAACARGPRALGAALHDQLLVAGERVDRAEQPLEREVQGADGDEDHAGSNTLPR